MGEHYRLRHGARMRPKLLTQVHIAEARYAG